MLAMRRENDQIFGSTNSNAINNNTISAPNDAVTDNCCSSNSYQDGELVFFPVFSVICFNMNMLKRKTFISLKRQLNYNKFSIKLQIRDWIQRLIRLASKNMLIFYKCSNYYWIQRQHHWQHQRRLHQIPVYRTQQWIRVELQDIGPESISRKQPNTQQQWPIQLAYQHRLHNFKVCSKLNL